MTLRAFVLIGGCAAAQLSVAACLSIPWWLPNVTLIGLVIAMDESPRARWRDVALLGGMVATAAAMPSQRWIGLAYPIAGWAAVGLGDRLELRASSRLQVAVALAEAVVLIVGNGPVGWSLVRFLSTVAAAPAVRRLAAPRRAVPSAP